MYKQPLHAADQIATIVLAPKKAPVSFQHAQIIENRYTYSCNKTCRVGCLNMGSSDQIPKEENSALFGTVGDGLSAWSNLENMVRSSSVFRLLLPQSVSLFLVRRGPSVVRLRILQQCRRSTLAAHPIVRGPNGSNVDADCVNLGHQSYQI